MISMRYRLDHRSFFTILNFLHYLFWSNYSRTILWYIQISDDLLLISFLSLFPQRILTRGKHSIVKYWNCTFPSLSGFSRLFALNTLSVLDAPSGMSWWTYWFDVCLVKLLRQIKLDSDSRWSLIDWSCFYWIWISSAGKLSTNLSGTLSGGWDCRSVVIGRQRHRSHVWGVFQSARGGLVEPFDLVNTLIVSKFEKSGPSLRCVTSLSIGISILTTWNCRCQVILVCSRLQVESFVSAFIFVYNSIDDLIAIFLRFFALSFKRYVDIYLVFWVYWWHWGSFFRFFLLLFVVSLSALTQ